MIKSEQIQQKYKCKFTNGSQQGYVDVNQDKGGQGEGFRPHELLEASLANCLNLILRMKADELGLKINDVVTEVELDRSKKGKTIFDYQIDYETEEQLSGAEQNKLEKAIKNCPIKQTLKQKIEFKNTM